MTPPKDLWSYIASGTKYIQYHSELAAKSEHVDFEHGEDYRVGVGLSRHAGFLVSMIETLRTDPYLKAILDKDACKKAMTEGIALLLHFQTLDFGKGSVHRGEQENVGLRGLRKRGRDDELKEFLSEVDIDAASPGSRDRSPLCTVSSSRSPRVDSPTQPWRARGPPAHGSRVATRRPSARRWRPRP